MGQKVIEGTEESSEVKAKRRSSREVELERLIERLSELPPSDLSRVARALVATDRESAEYLEKALASAMNGVPAA
jgi:hypothetical protein